MLMNAISKAMAVAAIAVGMSSASAALVNGTFNTSLSPWIASKDMNDASTVRFTDKEDQGAGPVLNPGSAEYNGEAGVGAVSQLSVVLLANHYYTLEYYLMGNIDAVSWSFGGLVPTGDGSPVLQNNGWTRYFFELDSGFTGGDLMFSFTGSSPIYLDSVAIIDDGCVADCSPTNPVPEPASLFLVGLGLAGVAMARRRKGVVGT